MEGYLSSDDFLNLYNGLYALMAIVVLSVSLYIDSRHVLSKRPVGLSRFLFLIAMAFTIVVGLREYNVGTDTEMYLFQFKYRIPPDSPTEVMFYLFGQGLKYLQLTFTSFLLLVAFLFFLFLIKSVNKIANQYQEVSLLIFFSFVSLFFIQNLAVNIIRQGLSLVLLLYAYSLSLEQSKRKKTMILFIVLAFMTHTTSIIPVLIYILCKSIGKKISIKWFILLYFLGVLLAAANIGVLEIAPFLKEILGADNRKLSYIVSKSSSYTVGFKPQFVVFNTIFLILFSLINSSKKNVKDAEWKAKYEVLFKYYLSSSFIFFMAFQIPYSDRWGLFSWMAIPILMVPYYNKLKSRFKFVTPIVLFFIIIYVFFAIYNNAKS